MEVKKNKSLIIIGITLIAISLFLLFHFDILVGALLLILGIFSIIFNNKKSKLPIIIFSIILLAYLIGSIIINLFIVFGFKFYLMIEYSDFTLFGFNFSTFFIEFVDSLMYQQSIPEFFNEIWSYLSLIFMSSDVAITVCLSVTLIISLLLVNTLSTNRTLKVVIGAIVAFISIVIIISNFKNLFLTQYGQIFISTEGHNIYWLIVELFDGGDIEYVLFGLYSIFLINKFSTLYVIVFALNMLSVIFACIGAATSIKKCN